MTKLLWKRASAKNIKEEYADNQETKQSLIYGGLGKGDTFIRIHQD